jgi:2,4-dienoyl-CoA reductase-like NADH-dependent reductase (Old Yellow Enzyme family)
MDGSSLFSPFRLRSIEIPNRVGMPPMCQYAATDGVATDWHLAHYATRAAGGVGLIIVEATAVTPEGRITPGCLGLWHDKHVEPLARVAAAIQAQGSVPCIQIGHAGRKASCALPWHGERQMSLTDGGWPTVAPSAVPFQAGERAPHALTLDEIEQIKAHFVAAARRALAAGFRALELHNAHGYLAHEFLSPLSNFRTDSYGGSFENRARFTLETVAALRAVWPDHLPLIVRVTCTDWAPGGWDVDDTVRLATLLKARGVDLLDCSSGGQVADAKIPVAPGFQVPFAERVRRETGLATATVGWITTARQAEDIIVQERADLVMLGRELLRNPYWALHAAKELGATPRIPLQYLRAY